MLFMVIENFKKGSTRKVYQRLDEQGRMTPERLKHINSWVGVDATRCFQLMECEDASLFDKWIETWSDLIEFEVVQVVTSEEAKQKALYDG